jgi:hypothetical protein
MCGHEGPIFRLTATVSCSIDGVTLSQVRGKAGPIGTHPSCWGFAPSFESCFRLVPLLAVLSDLKAYFYSLGSCFRNAGIGSIAGRVAFMQVIASSNVMACRLIR